MVLLDLVEVLEEGPECILLLRCSLFVLGLLSSPSSLSVSTRIHSQYMNKLMDTGPI